jgi:transposase
MKNDALASKNWEERLSQKDGEIAQKDSKIAELEALVKYYEGQLRLAARKQFGTSSEKSVHPEQLVLFDEAENTADRKAPEPTLEQITYTRKKTVGKREEDLSSLPVETVEHELTENERICPECGDLLHVMGKETRRELTIIPAQVKVTEHVRFVYSCRNCEKTAESTPILKAPMPRPVIKGSIASPSAVAHIMHEKYVTGTPLYRQEAEWQRQGVSLSRQTMANWIIKGAEDWLKPLYERMRGILLANDVLYADETVLQVLNEPGKKAKTNSYMWLYRTGGAKTPIVLYEYQPTRSSAHPRRFLAGWQGYLHTDGYAGYNAVQNVILVGCWAHMRRKFVEALTSLEAASHTGSHTASHAGSNAQKGLDYCDRLFALEREFADLTDADRFKARHERSLPVAEKFFTWVADLGALPKSALGTAATYAFGQRQRLMNVYLDGRLELSNNRAERSIKPFVIGRKNWLFCCSAKGANASAVVYSIIETAKENQLSPFEYLKFLFETLPNLTSDALDELLPWSSALPDRCKAAWRG